MGQVVGGDFVISNNLIVYSSAPNEITIEGEILCAGRIQISVNKTLAILDDHPVSPMVQTERYRYNVQLTGVGVIFRYDSPHPTPPTGPPPPPHHLEHHKHTYDVLNGDKRGTVTCIYDREQTPTLREVIDEASEWFYDNIDALLTE